MKKVLGDPGHGGTDPGATGNGHKEKDLTLKLALDVDKELKRHSVKSYLTRKDDRFISLENRSKIANDINADVFVSYHFNSFSNEKANGTEAYHYPNSTKGKQLATNIQNELNKIGLKNRGVKSANFSVLRRTKAPASLIEVCFISNKDDMSFFLSNYDKYVQAITKAIVDYLGIKYTKPSEDVKKPSKDKITTAKDKINIMLLAEHVLVDGFIKEGTSYVDINGSYVSIREILENLGLVVDWDKELAMVTADVNKHYKLEENHKDILLLGNKISVETYMHKDKNCLKLSGLYIPIRSVFESLGFKVDWNRANNMILVTRDIG